MTIRKWMPSEYQDEVVPPARPAPSDWIVKTDDGAPALASGDYMETQDTPSQPLSEGQTVHFDWVESYGHRNLTFHHSDDDGWTWELEGDEPEASPGGQMTIAEVGNWESMMPSLSEFASEYAGNGVDDGETITIEFYAWSNNSTAFVFSDGGFRALTAPAEPIAA